MFYSSNIENKNNTMRLKRSNFSKGFQFCSERLSLTAHCRSVTQKEAAEI